MEPVLLVTPYFAPQSHAAVFRVHKLAKYLPDHGFRPIVVTTGTNYLYNEDPGLLAELLPAVEIHRTRHVEPTARGLRMALGGRDRTFAALKEERAGEAPAPGGGPSRPLRRAARLLSDWPDRHWTWSAGLAPVLRALVGRHRIRLLYTTAKPVSPLPVAARLKRERGLAWVADARDPVGYGAKHGAATLLRAALERRCIGRMMAEADAVTGLARAYGSIFHDLYGLPPERFHFVPTGLDPALRPPPGPRPTGPGELLFVGEVMADQPPHAFAAVARAREIAGERFPLAGVTILGRRDVNAPQAARLGASVPSLPLTLVDHLPQAGVYRRIAAARACLVAPGPHGHWWNGFAKVADYIALGVPVVAHVPATSEARTELGRAGTALFLTGRLEDDARALIAWLAAPPPRPDPAVMAEYGAERQVARFAALFRSLLPQ